MRTRQGLPLALVSAVTLALAGCGGSSSGGSDPVAGPVTNPPPVNDPPPVAETITLSGKVTDAPIPNATVIVTVDGRQFGDVAAETFFVDGLVVSKGAQRCRKDAGPGMIVPVHLA